MRSQTPPFIYTQFFIRKNRKVVYKRTEIVRIYKFVTLKGEQ